MFAIHARVSCSVAVKLAEAAGGTRGQVIARLTAPVLRLAERYPSISTFSLADDSHFLIIVPIDFRVLPNLICCRPTFKFKPMIIIFNCSSNMVAEGIGR